MAKVALIPKHVSATMFPAELFDLIVTLRAAVREFGDTVPESIPALLEQFEAAYEGDLPPVEDEGGTAVAT